MSVPGPIHVAVIDVGPVVDLDCTRVGPPYAAAGSWRAATAGRSEASSCPSGHRG